MISDGWESKFGRVNSRPKGGGKKERFSWAEKGKWVNDPGPSKVVGRKRVRKIWQPKRVKPGSPKYPTLIGQYKGAKSREGNEKFVVCSTVKENVRTGEKAIGTVSEVATEVGGVEVGELLGSVQSSVSDFSVGEMVGGSVGDEGVETKRYEWESFDEVRNDLAVIKMGLMEKNNKVCDSHTM